VHKQTFKMSYKLVHMIRFTMGYNLLLRLIVVHIRIVRK